MNAVFSSFRDDLLGVCRAIPGAAKSVPGKALPALVSGLALTGVLSFLLDAGWAAAGDAPFGNGAVPAGRAISYYGELHWAPLITGLVLWYVGYKSCRVRWREAAVAALLAACLAGAGAAVLKGAVGRSRPGLHQPYEFVGPTIEPERQGFPSGHTTHSVAFAVALLLLAPEVGAPALIIPMLAAWGRLALHKHYPSDIAAGATLGVLGAMVTTAAVRRREAAAVSVSPKEETVPCLN